jgi:type IV pilus assembly protein PilC
MVSDGVNQGDSLGESLAATGAYFPPLFRELAAVGEYSGHLGECFAQLADHYDGQLRLRRTFLSSIAWPTIQLVLSLLIVGFLIWIMGVIGQTTGTKVDILGFGLVGTPGLIVYLTFLALIGGAIFFVIHAIQRGVLWVAPIQIALVKVPTLGRVLQTLALARMAWALHLTLDTGMELRRALKLSLESSHNAYFTRCHRKIDASIASGESLYESFRRANVFPADFLDTLHAGEESGRIVEAMAVLCRQYQEQAQAALKVLTILAGTVVWALIAAVIILLIFRIFSFYLGAINSALHG